MTVKEFPEALLETLYPSIIYVGPNRIAGYANLESLIVHFSVARMTFEEAWRRSWPMRSVPCPWLELVCRWRRRWNWVRRDWEEEMEERRRPSWGNPITSLSFPNQLNNSITNTHTTRSKITRPRVFRLPQMDLTSSQLLSSARTQTSNKTNNAAAAEQAYHIYKYN